MAPNLQSLINSQYGVGLAMGVGKLLPPAVGYRLADGVGGWIGGLRRTGIVRAVEANQWVVGGGNLNTGELDKRVRATFRQTGRCLYDLYHTLGRPEDIPAQFSYTPEFERLREQVCSGRQGTLIVTPHLGNFDLAGHAIASRGLRPLVLSYPQPSSGYQAQNRLRESAGLKMMPMSIQALRLASETLRDGGAVLTGVDRPIVDEKYRPTFFGRPAALPVSHIRLALKHNLPVTIVACQVTPEGGYQVRASDPIPMRPDPDLVSETVRNAEAVLRVIEEWIVHAPEQWAMFYPVWPETICELRGDS
jgi:phosphatidylinositol dimannoside acyltransferase